MSYKCGNCFKSFTSKQGLVSHWEAKQHSPGPSENYCYQCDRHFTSKIGLEQHLQHSQVHQTSYRCSVCNKTFNSEWSLNQHDETYCHHCERQFQDGNARQQHYQDAAVHRDKYCFECQRLCEDEEEKQMHEIAHGCQQGSFDSEDEEDTHDGTDYGYYGGWTFDDEDEENMHDKAYYNWHTKWGYDDAQNEAESLQSEEDEEVARQKAIEESRRKLAELEADKPLWEAAAKQRAKREDMERGSIRVEATPLHAVEKERLRAEAERKARAVREAEEKCKEDERRQREAEEKRKKEDERRQWEAAAQREREKQQRRWAYIRIWTAERALERYKELSEEFDSTKFTAELLPLIIEAVPWPVLTPPARLNIADVDWDAVEKFFSSVRDLMRPQEYKAFVEKSHRRFHPDRWQSRSLWKTVVDETERDSMEGAVNRVAQALTPIWRTVTGR
ncbi:hypothetical protein JOM56_001650 [Amanita muscaria]